MKNFTITGSYTDLYQLSMAQVYFLSGKANEEAVFDYFFRKLPFSGGYVVFAGLYDLLGILQDLRFNADDLEYLKQLGFHKDFIKTLKGFRFSGTIHAAEEGEVVFPTEPLLRAEGSILEVQLIETLVLNFINFQSLVATKAARMRSVAGNRVLSDFGMRRAQGLGAYHATRAAVIGGFDSTSNVKAGMDFGVPVIGTMAHSFIQSYDSELQAFRDFAEKRPEQCVLLADTYDTLRSGIPNAIIIGKEMEQRGHRLLAIRLDSGDLAYLSKQARNLLDAAGLPYVKIAVSNQLDEHVIKSLLDQDAPIDIFGVGTNLVTAPPDAALDGVFKLAYAGGKPRIKLSENATKITLPDKKQVYRVLQADGTFRGADVIALEREGAPEVMHHPVEPEKSMHLKGYAQEPLLARVMENGSLVKPKTLQECAAFSRERLKRLPPEHQRFEYPHFYKIGISDGLRAERNRLKQHYKQ